MKLLNSCWMIRSRAAAASARRASGGGHHIRRIPIAAVAVFGLGGLVAIAVGVSLYLGLSSATDNTRRLLQDQVDGFIDTIEQRIDGRLQPVAEQARWIASHVESGALDIHDHQRLDTFMFGALAGTPQVAGLAIVEPNGQSRRWGRAGPVVVGEDWADRPDIREWLQVGEKTRGAQWRAPLWTQTTETTVVLHDAPLRRAGLFLGMLGQIVPVSDLSTELVNLIQDSRFIPFVLYDRNHVLAHPMLINWNPQATYEAPLQRLEELGDAILERIWSPDEPELYLLPDLTRSSAVAAEINGNWYAFLYRDVQHYGPRPWTIGVYFNLDAEENTVLDRLLLAFASGMVVLCLSVVGAVMLGRQISRPIQAIATVAQTVREGKLADVPALPPSQVREVDEAAQAINEMVEGLRERQTIRETLGRYVPEQVAKTLLSAGGHLEVERAEATVLFCDLKDFTRLTEQLGPQRIVELLNAYFSAMVEILERHRGVVTQFQGDAILATFNVPVRDPDHATNALRAATEMQQMTRERTFAGHRIEHRIGINTGPVVAGAVGAAGRLSYTVHGDAVNLAARLEALNKTYGTHVLLSNTTAAVVHDFPLDAVDEVRVRGQSRPVTLFALRLEAETTRASPQFDSVSDKPVGQ